MKRLLALLAFLCAAAFSLPAAADHLDGVLPLHADDHAALAAAKQQPDRHVMLYFGDHLN
ncbi:hypothetical protein [Sulfuritalea sp.]|uniref:hypothetical protein n=1 Tax=Sulfuritalea sp. TaxID=2480090 RepID=UPI001ACA4215|nr:hypothetical protein [Sulfuritalea sp.]MBN8473687.1 hypothetical protein [Sulfuritalea sp.]